MVDQAPKRVEEQGRAGTASAADEVPLDEAGRVDADVCCMDCGYLLRTLRPEGGCPECGRSVVESLRSGPLGMASPAWLAGLSQGLTAMVVYFAAWVVCLVAFIPLMILATSEYWLWIFVVPTAIYLWGLWNLTRRDPGRAASQQPRRTARAALWGTALGSLCTALMFGSRYFLSGWSAAPPSWVGSVWLFGSLAVLRNLAHTLGFVGLLGYMVYLARRIPSNGLAAQCKIIAWAIAASGLAIFLATVAGAVGGYMMYSTLQGRMAQVSNPPTPTPAPSTSSGGSSSPTLGQSKPAASQPSQSAPTQSPSTSPPKPKGNHTGPSISSGGGAKPSANAGASAGGPLAVGAGSNKRSFDVGNRAPPTPTTAPDSTKTLGGGASVKTWTTQHSDGSSTTFARTNNANANDLITLTKTSANGNTTVTNYVVDGSNTIVRKNTTSGSSWSLGGSGSGGHYTMVAGLLLGASNLGMLAGFGGWLGFGIWAFVLVFVFRRQVRRALGELGQ